MGKLKSLVSTLLLGVLLGACLDENIEGAASSTPLTATSVTSAVTGLNSCSLGSGNLGTNFSATVSFSGSGSISNASYAYAFFTGSTKGTSGTVSSADFDVDGSAGGFRTTAGNLKVYFPHCVRFGTTTSIEYTYTIYTTSGDQTTIKLVINKPTGAN